MGSTAHPAFSEHGSQLMWRPGKPLKDDEEEEEGSSRSSCRSRCFYMPLHYPRYTEADYETMPEWKLDRLLGDYGIPATGDVADKRRFAIGAFLWPPPTPELIN